MEKRIYLELNGKFQFAMNQSGCDFKKVKQKDSAITDFWELFDEFVTACDKIGFLSLDYSADDLIVEEGE